MTRIVITGWEACPARAGDVVADGAGRRIAGFDVREALGAKRTRSMSRATGLAVATAGRLLARYGLDPAHRTGYADADLGVVLATSDNVQPIHEFNLDSWTRSRPYDVDPAVFPTMLMNVHAGQCAIWYRLRGPNSTVCGSHLGFLLALGYARRLHGRGHARALLCGAVEEYTPLRAAYAAARPARGARRPRGEGCVMFLLEQAGGDRPALAEVLAVEFGFTVDTGGVRAALTGCLERALARAGLGAERVGWVAPSQALGGRGDDERLAVKEVFGQVPLLTATRDALGDTDSVSAAFQLVEALSDPRTAGGHVAVTATDDEGRVGCALLSIA